LISSVIRWTCAPAVIAAATLAGLFHTGMEPVWAQIEDRPSQRPFLPRPGSPAAPGMEVLRVLGDVYTIAGAGANVVVQSGPQGLLVVDSGTSAASEGLLKAIDQISDKPIEYIINTTADPDHYGGNAVLAAAGWSPLVAQPGLTGANPAVHLPASKRTEELALVLAHEKMLNRISAPTGAKSEVPFAVWPTNTFFTAKKTMSFNHEGIELRYLPAAHTDGDLLVYFRRSDVVAAGDVVNPSGYPKFDPARGGSIQGTIDALNTIIDITIPEFNEQGGTRVVPGHGRVMNEADVAEYRDGMTIIRDRVRVAVEKKLTLQQLQALRPTIDYDALYGTPSWTGPMFVEVIYREMNRPAPGRGSER
jgi:glyoxylase-like metal-dependent hydrolase (beta-lactamase superfamily II)